VINPVEAGIGSHERAQPRGQHRAERRPDLKAIFTSGYSESFLKGREATDQNVPLLSKPYRKQKLLELVRKVLDAPAV
jgi:hypothetical protein